MQNNVGGSPTFEYPLPQEQVSRMFIREVQDYQLAHPEEMIRYQKEAERDILKSKLRQEEAKTRALLKMKSKEIYCTEDNIQLVVKTGDGREMSRKVAFRFGLGSLKVKRFRREGEKEFLLALILKSKEKKMLRLYPAAFASSPLKLRAHTFLSEYEGSLTDEERRFCWAWLQKRISEAYADDIDNIIPSKAGFFQAEKGICFWADREGLKPFLNETIGSFSLDVISGLDPDDIVRELAGMAEKIGMEERQLGVLLVVRLYTLLSNLATEAPPNIGVILSGEDSAEIARGFLRVLDSGESSWDFFNLDSDRISLIRERIKRLRNTPAFFVASGSGGKAFWNRFQDVYGWLQNGLIEGTRLTVPMIFCVRELPVDWPLDNLVVVQVAKRWLHDGGEVFDKLQSYIIEAVENSGIHWGEALKRHFQEQEKNDDWRLLSLLRAIKVVALQILDLHEEANGYLCNLLDMGLGEIAAQVSLADGYLLQKFRLGVCHEVEAGTFNVFDLTEHPEVACVDGNIFFDGENYLFTHKLLCSICEALGFVRKAALYIKRELSSQGYLKQYKGSGLRPKEYEIDLMLEVNDKKTKVSVLAVRKEFWDEPGEVALFERGWNE